MPMDMMTLAGVGILAVVGVFFLAPALSDAIGGAGSGAVSGGLGAGGTEGGGATIPIIPIIDAPATITAGTSTATDTLSDTSFETSVAKFVNAGQTPVNVVERGTSYIYAGEGYVPAPTGKTGTSGFSGKSEWGQAATAQPKRPDPSKDPIGALDYDVQMAQSSGGSGKASSVVLGETVSTVKDRETLGIAISKAPIGADISALLAQGKITKGSDPVGYSGGGKEQSQSLAKSPTVPATKPGVTTVAATATTSSASTKNTSRTDSSGKSTQTFTSKGWVSKG